MMSHKNLVSFADLYGISNGLFITSAIFTFFFALSFASQKHQRKFSLLYALISIAFLSLCTFNIFFQSFHFSTLTSQAYPSFILLLGKVTPPLAMNIFIYLFITETAMVSKKAYDIVDRFKVLIHGLYTLNFIAFLGLFFIKNHKNAMLIILILFVIQLVLSATYAFKGLARSSIGKLLFYICVANTLVYIVIIYYILIGFETLPKNLIFTGHTVLSLLAVLLSFVSINFGHKQLYKFKSAAHGKNRQLINYINTAIKNNEFFMVYQPKLEINDQRICGVEALIRWIHPKLGFIPPDEFITVAESTHLIDSICEWVIVATAKQARLFKDGGYNIPISINFSVKNLNPCNIHFLFDVMEQYNLEPGSIIIEITETVFMQHNDQEKEALAMLHEKNIPISLDDYGTGHSSLSSINQLALSEIKIDRCFVFDLHHNHQNHIIVRSTLQMTKELGVKVVAEGIEHIETIEMLKEMHCDMVQGYAIAEPMRADDMISWLKKSSYSYARQQTTPQNHNPHILNV